jgi:molecular chaperone GrpE
VGIENKHVTKNNTIEEKTSDTANQEVESISSIKTASHSEAAAVSDEISGDMEALKKQLDEKTKELEQKQETLLRVVADTENFKKRIEREKADYYKFANEKLIVEILNVVDDLKRAIKSAESTRDFDGLVAGIKMILGQVQKILSNEGVTSIDAVGQKFDPVVHEALMQLPSDEYEENTVVEEFQKGYFLKDRLIRPAKVTVAKNLNKEE